MKPETYTPGHTTNTTDFMSKRTLESHGRFFVPYLARGHDVLDLGCGPGTITAGIAVAVAPGSVTGIDFAESQIAEAEKHLKELGIENAVVEAGTCYSLPFADDSFDRVFCHALLEHLAEPLQALKEAYRVLKPGGLIGVCSPDCDGWLFSPPSDELDEAAASYAALQESNGGDLRIGKKFGVLLRDAGFRKIQLSARYECYPSLEFIGEYLALQLEQQNQHQPAATFRKWAASEAGLFAQSWVSAVGAKRK